jgi:hypothetical protein
MKKTEGPKSRDTAPLNAVPDPKHRSIFHSFLQIFVLPSKTFILEKAKQIVSVKVLPFMCLAAEGNFCETLMSFQHKYLGN